VIERRKVRFQERIEDLEMDADILDHQIMQFIQEMDRLKSKMSLASYQPYRQGLDKEYETIRIQKDELYEQYLNKKSQIANIIYDIEELDLEINRLIELVGINDS
jgi:hypothetical protein